MDVFKSQVKNHQVLNAAFLDNKFTTVYPLKRGVSLGAYKKTFGLLSSPVQNLTLQF